MSTFAPEQVKETLLFLLTAGLVVPLFRRFKISPVIGFLCAGAALGPHGLGSLAHKVRFVSYFALDKVGDIEPIAETWRARMQALLDAEGSPPARKDRLAGAYNRGLRGYTLTYRTCTPNARLVIHRFLDETSRIARDLGNRYRSS